MKKTLFLLLSLLCITGFTLVTRTNSKKNIQRQNFVISPTLTEMPEQKSGMRSLFVPYWSLSTDSIDTNGYDQLLYFGVMPTSTGLNLDDAGYLHVASFSDKTEGKQKLLVLRMLDSKLNFTVLKEVAMQKKIIQQTVDVAKSHGFSGIVLDLELSALPFDSLLQQINSFTGVFYRTAKKEQMSFAITMYGDTFYRVRPFDVRTMAANADQIMVMAYDFSKAGGNPGPNFPLSGKDTYGYDYSELTEHFLSQVPAKKLTIVFGLFGYDWQVDDKNIAQKLGNPLSYLEIKQQILDKCSELQCVVTHDAASAETHIAYMDSAGIKHTVWFEDLDSVRKKEDYLKSRGINNFSYWAYSYF